MAAPAGALKADSTPVSTGLTALMQPTRVSLLQRGQYREHYLRTHQNGVPCGSLRRTRSRHLSATAFTRSTRNMLAAGDDHLEDLLKGVAASINSPDHLPQSEKNALILQAALGLWMRRHEARGFRRWKESTLNRVDLPALIATGVNVHEGARQLLLAAETKRRMLANERRVPLNSHDDDEKWMAANFSYAEMDLLLAWARHTQPKTCRGVDDNTLREALRYLRFNQYQDGEAIFFQGDKGDVFYLVLDGNVGIYGAKRTQPTEKHKRKQSVWGDSAARKRESVNIREKPDMNLMGPRIFTYRAGESFGETALFTNAAVRTATAIAFGNATSGFSAGSVCELGEISRGAYSRTLKRFHQHFFTQAQRVNFTQRVFLFKDWPRPRVVEVAEVLELRRISFGSVLLTEGVTPLSHCFFVLSGMVNITTQLEVKSQMNDDSQTLQKAAALKKARRRNQITIELHTVRVGEIVALEALLEDEDSTARLTYTAVAGSADVEVYALKRIDGRAFLVSSTTDIMHQVKTICATERAHREERIEVARRALSERENSNKKHRLELENEALELGLTDKQQYQRHKQQELENIDKNSTPRAHLGLQRPFLPHMDPVKLLVGVDGNNVAKITTGEPRVLNRSIEIDTSLGEVAVPPKMLSTLVKNFIVRDGDTLADDYAQRLTLQLPVRSPLSPLINRVPPSLTCIPNTMVLTQMHTARRRHTPASTMSARLYDELQTRDTHIRQLSMNYDAKMHWNPKKKNFELVQVAPSNKVRQMEEETAGDQNLQTKLHFQLQTAHTPASVELTHKQDEYSGPPNTFVRFC